MYQTTHHLKLQSMSKDNREVSVKGLKLHINPVWLMFDFLAGLNDLAKVFLDTKAKNMIVYPQKVKIISHVLEKLCFMILDGHSMIAKLHGPMPIKFL